jgi:DNA-binding CsgD family transcriptional regulator
VRFQLGHALTKLQEYDAARTELELAITDLGHDPGRAARAMVLLGWPLDEVQPASAHLAWLRRAAVQVLPAPGSSERIRIDMDRTIALLLLGDPSGWSLADEMPAHGGSYRVRRSIGNSHLNASHAATMWGRYAESRRRFAAADQLARTDDLGNLTGMIAVNRAHLDLFTGRWEGLAERAEALAANEELPPMSRLEAELIRERLRLAVEPPADDDSRLVALLAAAVRHGATPETMEPAAVLARLRLDTGRPVEAAAISADPIRVVERKRIWIWATELAPVHAEALIAGDRIDEAAALVAAFESGLGELDAPAPRAALMLCRALLTEAAGDPDRAAGYDAAAAAWDLLPRPYDALLARERQARCLLADGRTDAAVELLTAVFDGLTGLGARPAAARVAETLRRYGAEVRTPWRGGSRGYGDELSPRELDVVRLLVGGRTNREIGQVLFLSPKTVARHLNSAMRKLGVTTRTALAVRAVEGDLDNTP